MVVCREVIQQLWDYLDGELPFGRMEAIAAHLVECALCYPRYRFEFAFLALLARQRASARGPSETLVERIRELGGA
jgi:anti-sigma factor RsiW